MTRGGLGDKRGRPQPLGVCAVHIRAKLLHRLLLERVVDIWIEAPIDTLVDVEHRRTRRCDRVRLDELRARVANLREGKQVWARA